MIIMRLSLRGKFTRRIYECYILAYRQTGLILEVLADLKIRIINLYQEKNLNSISIHHGHILGFQWYLPISQKNLIILAKQYKL